MAANRFTDGLRLQIGRKGKRVDQNFQEAKFAASGALQSTPIPSAYFERNS